jgi:monoamine oxidase
MLDTAIIGGGLCGLSLAMALHDEGRPYALFEARPRLGGRVLSRPTADGAARVDLGPTWFWPRSEPLITRLVAQLQLDSFAQYDAGNVLTLDDPDKSASIAHSRGVHDDAQRLTGGMASLIDALTARLPADCVHLEHTLEAVMQRGQHVELQFVSRGVPIVIPTRRAVLAMPPRLTEQLRFEPPLDDSLHAALRATPTWMATQAKAVLRYEQAAWRSAGHSGSAFVRHEQAALSEIFDACDAGGAALGGFVALSPEQRHSFRAGLPMLLGNQVTQIFGAQLQERELLLHDWATEPYTCSRRDLADAADNPVAKEPTRRQCDAILRQPAWNGTLHFGGTETAARAAGHLEGALEAAQRIRQDLGTFSSTPVQAVTPGATVVALRRRQPANASINEASLERFRSWVQAQQRPVFDDYRQRINRSLALQERDQLAQRAMLGAMEEVFSKALEQLTTLHFDCSTVPVERGRSALTPQVQAAFQGFIQTLLDEVVNFNRTSCALSNFPGEHQLSKEYEQTILRDVAAAWREFSLAANSLLLGAIAIRGAAR